MKINKNNFLKSIISKAFKTKQTQMIGRIKCKVKILSLALSKEPKIMAKIIYFGLLFSLKILIIHHSHHTPKANSPK